MEEDLPTVSKAFLEENLGKKVESWTIRPGTNIGDNYLSVLYAIEVKLSGDGSDPGKGETVHLISKCYPTHPARQEFLNRSNMFWNELSIYQVLIPELERFSEKLLGKLPFPPLIGGKAMNFRTVSESGEMVSHVGKVYNLFEIYILMTDIRKTFGFQMANRHAGLNIAQMRLAIQAHAQLHSVSWAYKELNGLQNLSDRFDFLKFELGLADRGVWLKMMGDSIDLAADTVEGIFGPELAMVKRAREFKNHLEMLVDSTYVSTSSEEILLTIHREPPAEKVESEVPWRVLIHGDCWTNNMLFKFDELTKEAVELTLVDLQLMRENCPTFDLVYLIYSSTTAEFRKSHLPHLLELYHSHFVANCQRMGVAPLPGFTLEELRRRFHRSKIVGYFFATLTFPLVLKDAKDVVDLETAEGDDMIEMFRNFADRPGQNDIYTRRIVSLVKELYDEGVL